MNACTGIVCGASNWDNYCIGLDAGWLADVQYMYLYLCTGCESQKQSKKCKY